MTQRIVLFNGPPRSGKDTAARHVFGRSHTASSHIEGQYFVFDRMSMPIKKAFAGTIALPIDKWGNVDYWENHKEEIIKGFGVTYRQWQIDFSERFMKPLYGEDIFAKLFISRAKRQHKDAVILVPDCGFDIEYKTLAEHFGINNVIVVEVQRPGHTFEGDSRYYLKPLSGQDWLRNYVVAHNDGTQADFEARILQIVKEWLEK